MVNPVVRLLTGWIYLAGASVPEQVRYAIQAQLQVPKKHGMRTPRFFIACFVTGAPFLQARRTVAVRDAGTQGAIALA